MGVLAKVERFTEFTFILQSSCGFVLITQNKSHFRLACSFLGHRIVCWQLFLCCGVAPVDVASRFCGLLWDRVSDRLLMLACRSLSWLAVAKHGHWGGGLASVIPVRNTSLMSALSQCGNMDILHIHCHQNLLGGKTRFVLTLSKTSSLSIFRSGLVTGNGFYAPLAGSDSN